MMKKSHIIIFFIIEVLIIFLIMIFILKGITLPECYFYKNYGILCPSCGGTRCVTNFFRGNLTESFKYNKIYFVMILYLILLNIVMIINLVSKKAKMTILYPRIKYLYVFILIWLIYFILRNIF